MGSNFNEVIDETKIKQERQEELNDWPDQEMKPSSLVQLPLENSGPESLDVKEIKTEQKDVLPISEPDPGVILSLVPFVKLKETLENKNVVSTENKIKLENVLIKHTTPMDPNCKEMIEETKIKKEEINDWPESEKKPGSLVPWALENTGQESLDVKDIKTELKDVLPYTDLSPGVKSSLFLSVKLERKYEIENALSNRCGSKLQIKQELKDYKLYDIESKLTLEKSNEDKLSFPTFYICENCDKCFEERNSLEKHECSCTRSGSRNTIRIVQNIKAKITRQKSHIDKKNVTRWKQELKSLVCHYCNQTFILKEDLVMHLRNHKENNYNRKKFICNDCGKKFWHKVDMLQHPCMMPTVKNEKRKLMDCDICNTTLRTARGLELHMRIHYIANPLSCKFCGKVIKRVDHLLEHEHTHIGIRPYKCNYCNKHFGQKSHLRVHERIHKKSKPYSCRQCGKSYSDKRNVSIHELTHSGARPFSCDDCGKKFTQKSHLNTHKATHSSERKYSCQVCGLSFKQRGTLQTHVYLHMDEKPYNCRVCKKGFCQQNAFRIHLCNKGNDLL